MPKTTEPAVNPFNADPFEFTSSASPSSENSRYRFLLSISAGIEPLRRNHAQAKFFFCPYLAFPDRLKCQSGYLRKRDWFIRVCIRSIQIQNFLKTAVPQLAAEKFLYLLFQKPLIFVARFKLWLAFHHFNCSLPTEFVLQSSVKIY